MAGQASAAAMSRSRLIVAGIVGNVMEWYDFAIYGYFVSTIGQLYFPASDKTASLLAAYGAFAVGFVVRPIGAAIFGHIADRIGRAYSLIWSVVAMTIPSVCIGFLPTYQDIGVAASLLMLLLRILQGLAVGGEYVGSVVFLTERAPTGNRGLDSSWPTFGATLGFLLGSAAGTVIYSALSPAEVSGWGFRVPFLLGALVGVTGFMIRRHLTLDTPPAKAGYPLLVALRTYPKEMAQAIGISVINGIGFYLLFSYIVTWLQLYSDIRPSTSLAFTTVNMAIMMAVTPLAGALSDRIGRKPVLLYTGVGMVVLTVPLWALMKFGGPPEIFLAQLVFALLVGAYSAVNPVAICEIFPPAVRSSAASTAYNITMGFAGGTAPIVATWMIERSHRPGAPAVYLVLSAVVSTLAVLSVRSFKPREDAAVGAAQTARN
jgi:MHS family proline/betaine transporter-like MFS transporter